MASGEMIERPPESAAGELRRMRATAAQFFSIMMRMARQVRRGARHKDFGGQSASRRSPDTGERTIVFARRAHAIANRLRGDAVGRPGWLVMYPRWAGAALVLTLRLRVITAHHALQSEIRHMLVTRSALARRAARAALCGIRRAAVSGPSSRAGVRLRSTRSMAGGGAGGGGCSTLFVEDGSRKASAAIS